jgi:hypothetical protein
MLGTFHRKRLTRYEWRATPGHFYSALCRTFFVLPYERNRLNKGFRHRKQQLPEWPSPQQLLQENPYTPTSTLAQAIMHSSRLFYELVIIREWLHDTAPPPPVPDAATGYWKFTKYQLMQALRTGNRMQSDGLVREMDPDAPNRDDARGLAADDAVRVLVASEIAYH